MRIATNKAPGNLLDHAYGRAPLASEGASRPPKPVLVSTVMLR